MHPRGVVGLNRMWIVVLILAKAERFGHDDQDAVRPLDRISFQGRIGEGTRWA
jgi:hypothetical protein